MQNNNQQFNYPLTPDFISEKKHSRFKQWFFGLAPRNKFFAVFGLVLAIVGICMAGYFIFAALNAPSIKFDPPTDEWILGSGWKNIKVILKTDDPIAFNAQSQITISYTDDIFHDVDEEDGRQIFANTTDSANWKSPEIKRIENKIILKPKTDFQYPIGERQILNINIMPIKAGFFEITSTGIGEPKTATYEIKNSGNVIYLSSLVENENEFELGETGSYDIKFKADNDMVAFAANIEYDPTKIKIENIGDTQVFKKAGVPEEGNNEENGIYSIVRYTFGDGNMTNGTTTPFVYKKGFKGNEIVATISFTTIGLGDTKIKIKDAKAVSDDGNGTIITLPVHEDEENKDINDEANIKIVPQLSVLEKAGFGILNSSYQCSKNLSSGYDITASWDTNKEADGKLEIPGTTNIISDESDSKNHNLTINVLEAVGKYLITSKTQIADTLSAPSVEETDSKTVDYNCEIGQSILSIKNLVIKPSDKTAEISFMTSGGANNGSAKGKLEKLEIRLSKDSNGIYRWGNMGGNAGNRDWKDGAMLNLHKFILGSLNAENTYRLTLTASDEDAANSEKDTSTTIFETKPKDTAKNTNIILKVDRDRECASWLYCNSSVQIKNTKNKLENLCFSVGLCDKLDGNGNCISPKYIGALGVSGGNQTYDAPQKAIIDNPTDTEAGTKAENIFKNLSGLSAIGLDWGTKYTVIENGIEVIKDRIKEAKIEGLKHVAAMETVGKNINLPNGNFELADIWPWQANDIGEISAVQDSFQSGNTNIVNNVLQITASASGLREISDSYAGAKIPLGKITGGSDYILSFTARTSSEVVKDLLLQVRNYDSSGNSKFSNFLGTDNTNIERTTKVELLPKTYVIKSGLNLLAGNAEIIFNQKISQSELTNKDKKNNFYKPLYIDNVSMQPVLQIQNSVANNDAIEEFVARSCRMYPNVSALDCNMISTGGKMYRGWKGFCIEKDPGNPNLCLNWYPVDIISGETDIFASDSQAGYKDRKPLYYCLESSGNYPYVREIDVGTGVRSDGGSVAPQLLNIPNKDVIGGVGWQDLSYTYTFNLSTEYKFLETEIEKIVLEPICEESDKHCFSKKANSDAWLVFDKKNNWYGYFCVGGTSCPSSKPTVFTNFEGKEKTSNSDMFNAKFIVEDHKLTKIDTALYNWGGKDDPGYVGYKVKVYLREQCNILVQTVDPFGQNFAFASKILKNGWIGSSNALSYKYDQDYTPYGAAVPPAVDTNHPENWTEPLYVMPPDTSFGMSPYQVRAGSPYAVKQFQKVCVGGSRDGVSCSSDINCLSMDGLKILKGACVEKKEFGTQCILGSEDSLGKGCETNYDCGFGLNGESGLCMGVNLTDAQQNIIGGGYKKGKERLSELFARALSAWVWSPEDEKYLQVCASDYTVDCNTASNPSSCQFYKELCWDSREKGTAPQVNDIKVNDRVSGDIYFSGAGSVVLKFNSFVSQDQFPLKAYRVDWGDDTQNEVTNLSVAPKIDPKDPHIMLHTYICQGETDEKWSSADGGCKFIPKVQIEDNWGWCNGIDNASVTTCVNSGKNPSECICPADSEHTYWAKFGGKIIVKP
jgi:hypothetical protein